MMTDDEILKASEELVNSRTNDDGMPEFSSKQDFDDFMVKLLSIGGNEVKVMNSSENGLDIVVKFKEDMDND